jgi:hypothetical protein
MAPNVGRFPVSFTRLPYLFISLAVAAGLSLFHCQSSVSTDKNANLWTFSGYVIDGSTQKPLSGVRLTYLDNVGTERYAETDSTGKFFVDDLPFGDRSFRFSRVRADSTAPAYTEKIVVVSSYTESRIIEGLVADISRVVTLYPLSGAVKGKVLIKLSGSGRTRAVPNAVLKISYKDSTMTNAAPSQFSFNADSTGSFEEDGLPLAPGAVLAVNSFTVNDATYGLDPVQLTNLFTGKAADLGALLLAPKDSSTTPLMSLIRSNVLSGDGFGLSDVPVSVRPFYVLPPVFVASGMNATLTGGGAQACSTRVSGDTITVVPEKNIAYDTLVTITLTGLDTSGNGILLVFDGAKRFRTEVKPAQTIRSNVLSLDQKGLSGAPVSIHPWYILSGLDGAAPVTAAASGVPTCAVRRAGDTVFVEPAQNLPCDSLITVTIIGVDISGNLAAWTFDGEKRFRTEKNIFPIASNAWNTPGANQRFFTIYDTLWIAFSEPIDPDVEKIRWLKSSASAVLYGAGAQVNARSWTGAETLFVRPDQRLSVGYGQTMGFKVRALSKNGRLSDSVDIVANVAQDPVYVAWTNTKDAMGIMRRDFGPRDTVFVVASGAVAAVRGVSGMTGMSTPPGLSLTDVALRGDTIVYAPSLLLEPDSTYGVDFDVLFKDGSVRNDALGVSWRTARRLQIVSVDNKSAGAYRRLKVIGDSVTVTFSAPIDVSAAAVVPFTASITDVRGRSIRTITHWNTEGTAATILNLDTLPAADFDASPAYTGGAVKTRAVSSLYFTCVTLGGEVARGLTGRNDSLELHTEPGLCVAATTILHRHDERKGVDRTETPTFGLPANARIDVTFDRPLDAAAMSADTAGLKAFAGLHEGSGAVSLDAAVSLSADGRTLSITPSAELKAATDYFVWCRNVPAAGIAGAAAINKDAGSFSGKSTNYNLLDSPFRVR